MWSKSKPNVPVEFQYGGHLGEFHGMSSQSHLPHCRVANSMSWSQGCVSHCRVLPLDSRASTLQGAVTWQNQCHYRATLQGVIISSAILKIVFCHILFCFFKMQFGLWRPAAFVSSLIHLFFIACESTHLTAKYVHMMDAGYRWNQTDVSYWIKLRTFLVKRSLQSVTAAVDGQFGVWETARWHWVSTLCTGWPLVWKTWKCEGFWQLSEILLKVREVSGK